jgi:hypothetical protein
MGQERPARRNILGDELPEDGEPGRDAPVLETLVNHGKRRVHSRGRTPKTYHHGLVHLARR